MNDEILSDGELLRATQKGDEPTQRDAKDKLVNKYDSKLNHFVVGYLHRKNCNQPAAHAKGVQHHTWINAFANISRVNDPKSFESWLFTIGRNEANRHLKLCIGGQNSSVQIDDSVLPPAEISPYYSSKDAAMDADRMIAYAYSVSEEDGSIFTLFVAEE